MALFARLLENPWAKAIGLALLLFVCLRLFVFDVFVVNNRDMEGTYQKWDVLLVKKHPVAFSRGQVLLLEYPLPDSGSIPVRFVQRLAGLPGDSLWIHEKTAFANGHPEEDIPLLKHNYFIKTRLEKLDSIFSEKYGLNEGGRVSEALEYSYALTKDQKSSLEKDSLIDYVKLKTEKEAMFDDRCFPGSSHFRWNTDHYGKIYIPRKNDSLRLDTNVLCLYEDLIVRFENNQLDVRQDSIFINGVLTTYYHVKQNYFFVLGDNRDNAQDSRHWGFLPQSCIKARVIARLKASGS